MGDRVPPLEGPIGDVELGHEQVHGAGRLDERVDASDALLASNEPPSGSRQALQEDLSLTEEVEKIKNEDKVFYKLGKHSKGFRHGKKYGPEEDVHLETVRTRTPASGKALRLYGYVDATKFKEISYSNAFYNIYIKAANEIRACFQLLDKETQEWYKSLGDLIDEFADMGSFDRKKWAEIKKNKNYLDKKNGVNKIYTKDGLFNFLLSWKRVVNIQPGLAEASKSDFNVGTLGLRDGSISLRFSDKVKSQKHRFAAKVEEEVVESPEIPVIRLGEAPSPVQPGTVINLPQGGTVTNLPQGGTVTNLPQGGTVINLPQGGTVTPLPQGGSTINLPQGGTTINLPQGGTVTPLPQGGTVINLPQGGTTINLPQGGTVTPLPQGGTIINLPQGGTVTPLPQGGSTINLPQGGTTTNLPQDGGAVINVPQGGTSTNLPQDGGAVINVPQGATVTQLPQGGISITIPQGETVNLPQGGTITTLPQGGTSVTLPQGTESNLPQGGTINSLPQGGTAINLPQSGTTINLPNGGTVTSLEQGGTVINLPAEAGTVTPVPQIGTVTNVPSEGTVDNLPQE